MINEKHSAIDSVPTASSIFSLSVVHDDGTKEHGEHKFRCNLGFARRQTIVP